MGFWGTRKKTIRERNWYKLERDLRNRDGFDKREVNEVKQVFRGDFDQESQRTEEHGIDNDEIDRGIESMKENPKTHRIGPEKIDKLSARMKEHLR